ncbi:hypothetical protein BDV96DRAFT_602286 [Lophiotrema nucula]|uniref:Uncharacterized protein n=1 Tax=Lophiotrema nucula TaxID=690887 RepID=A0A6A5YZX7_9PLEO|nr:hypothetical protein BDV96DRAFT_602286 [Lophiotrema nucula]
MTSYDRTRDRHSTHAAIPPTTLENHVIERRNVRVQTPTSQSRPGQRLGWFRSTSPTQDKRNAGSKIRLGCRSVLSQLSSEDLVCPKDIAPLSVSNPSAKERSAGLLLSLSRPVGVLFWAVLRWKRREEGHGRTDFDLFAAVVRREEKGGGSSWEAGEEDGEGMRYIAT